MSPESIEKIEHLTRQAEFAKRLVPAPTEPDGVYYVAGTDGTFRRVSPLKPAARHAAADLPTLAAVARAWDEFKNTVVAVWYDRDGVVAVCDQADIEDAPRETCGLNLTPSPQLALLADWRKRQTWAGLDLGQRELVQYLRTTLYGCWEGRHPGLLDAVRRLRTQKAADVVAEVQRGKASLGRSMTAEASGAGDIPEYVTFEVPVFAGAAVRAVAEVRVVLDPNPETEKFSVSVLPDDVERAFRRGEEATQALLDGLLARDPDADTESENAPATVVPVYHGKP